MHRPTHAIFLLAFIILAFLAISYLRWVGNISTVSAIFYFVLSAIVIWLSVLLWIPNEFGRVKWRRISLSIISATALGFGVKSLPDIIKLLEKHKTTLPDILNKYQISSTDITIFSVIILIIGILAILHKAIRDNTIGGRHIETFNDYFPEKDAKSRIKNFCRVLENELNKLDIETNWSDAHFVPIEADVDVDTGNKKLKRISNLLNAIRRNKTTKNFLIIGEPGSGKSVVLRKLAKDMLAEVHLTYKIPIYINLKEWQIQQKWDANNPPTYIQLYDFVVSSLKGRDIFADDFIDVYFKKLQDNGHIFFIFDSFDEIPTLLDEENASWLIDKLSEVFNNFLAGAADSRGVLASRPYRKPTNKFQTKTILTIRPFSELKIQMAFKKYINFNPKIINEIFTHRLDLIPIASNPFTTGLIYNYVKYHGKLPDNQSELYSDFINQRLNANAIVEKINNAKLKESLFSDCIRISTYMFKSEGLGLEAPLVNLRKEFGNQINDVAEILSYAKIGRMGSSAEKRFGFVHRRFNEYFVVQDFIQNPDPAKYESIATDSRYRDCLVLYCEVAEKQAAIEIALFCWREIKAISFENTHINMNASIRAINCLRFMNEAFRTRKDILNSFINDFTSFITQAVDYGIQSNDILFVKILAESTALLQPRDVENILAKVLQYNNEWVNETAIRACRSLPFLSDNLQSTLRKVIQRMDDFSFLSKYEDLTFSLKLSDGFKKVYNECKVRMISIIILISGSVMACFLNRIHLVLFIGFFLITMALEYLIKSMKVSIFNAIKWYFLIISMVILYLVSSHMILGHRIYFYKTCIFVYVAITLVPYYDIIWRLKSLLTKMRTFDVTKWVRDAILSIIGVALLFGLTVGVIYLLDNKLFRSNLKFIQLIFFFLLFFLQGKEYLKDYTVFKRFKKSVYNNRAHIGKTFSQLTTQHYRYIFVRFLETNVQECIGEWPDGKIPFKNDEASTHLAKLEAKWLRIN